VKILLYLVKKKAENRHVKPPFSTKKTGYKYEQKEEGSQRGSIFFYKKA
jgi:hypothetical protein